MKKIYQATNYENDLTDKQWEEIKKFFPSRNKSKYPKRAMVEAVLYVVDTGFQVIPNRWKIERTVSSAETMFIISHAHTLLKRL